MKKAIIFILTVLAASGALAGCSNGNGTSIELTAAEVGERIGQSVHLENLKQGDAAKLQKLYHPEPDIVENFVLYTAASNVKADELAIIQVKDASDAVRALAGIRQRIEAQTTKFQDYRPKEYYLIEKHVLKTKGRFILFAVSEDADRIEDAFDKALTE